MAASAAASAVDPAAAYATVRSVETVVLYPMQLRQRDAHVEVQLNKCLKRWQPRLNGVPVQLLRVVPRINDLALHEELPYMQIQAWVEWRVFRPRCGDLLRGTVTQLGIDHLSLLVHGLFNATIARDNLPDAWEYHEYRQAFVYSGVPAYTLEVDSVVVFRVERIDIRRDVFTIMGNMKVPGTG
jgi:hypothetical protein